MKNDNFIILFFLNNQLKINWEVVMKKYLISFILFLLFLLMISAQLIFQTDIKNIVEVGFSGNNIPVIFYIDEIEGYITSYK